MKNMSGKSVGCHLLMMRVSGFSLLLEADYVMMAELRSSLDPEK